MLSWFAPESTSSHLLGRYDVCVVRACADFDRDWNSISQARHRFWVLHAAALNIGESVKASDFSDFACESHVLDENGYLSAMKHIMDNIVKAAITLGVEQFIFFPFGMGAFLRHLSSIDVSYKDAMKMTSLRRGLALRFLKSMEAFTSFNVHVHLCLSFAVDEARQNADAFIRAAMEASGTLRSRLKIWPNGDCLDLAHRLALHSPKVSLVNGANRRMLGNHWFAGHALRAIDENLHRRSVELAAASYALNQFDSRSSQRLRSPTELKTTVERLGGQVVEVEVEPDFLGSLKKFFGVTDAT